MDTSLSLTYQTLPEGAPRHLFALYADLPAGATAELLKEVLGEASDDAIEKLYRRSLLHREGERWYMPIPASAYAAGTRIDAVELLRGKLDATLAVLAEHLGDVEWFRDREQAIRTLTTELPNLHAALDRATKRGDPAYVLRVTLALFNYYPIVMPGSEASRRLKAGVLAAREIADRRGEAGCLLALGHVSRRLRDLAVARERYAASLELYRETGDRQGEANSRWSLGHVHRLLRDYPTAREGTTAAWELYREIGDRLGEANSLCGLGWLHYNEGDRVGAVAWMEQASALFAEIGNTVWAEKSRSWANSWKDER